MTRRKTSHLRIGAVGLTREPNLGSHSLTFNDNEVIQLLRAAIEREGSQIAFAKHYGVNRTYLNMILSGKRPVGDAVAKALGLHKVYIAQ
jgi:hypothetical protein